jgi:hypothetical protein
MYLLEKNILANLVEFNVVSQIKRVVAKQTGNAKRPGKGVDSS